jgi:predicted nucleic acid-binding protein
MVIGLIEGTAEQRQLLKKYLPNYSIYSNELVRLEARLLAIRENNFPIVQEYNDFFSACEFIPLNRDVFECATALRAEKQLKTPDALHLASAMVAECDEFWTNDLRLAKYAAGKIIVKDWAQLEMLMKN